MAEIANYAELARLQTDEEAARRRQQQAQQLMQAGYNPVPNANPILSVLASVMSTIKGDSMLKDSDAKISDVLAKKFELQNREDQAKAEAEQRRRQEDWDRELQKIEITAQTGAKYREPRNIDPNSPEGIAARLQFERGKTGMQPQAAPAIPEYQKIIDAARAQGIQLSPEELKQVVTGLKPAAPVKEKPKEMDVKAAAAAQAREILDSLEKQIPSSGPIDGRLPTPGAQGFDRSVAQLVNPFQTLTRIPGQGSQSDAELKRLMESFPSVTNYESVNKESIANLRSYLDKIQGMQGQAAPQAPQGAPQPAQGQPTQTATNPQTGQKIGLINGQWVPI
ncbi:hypothetical protein K0U83_14820 [bacterium]|nr:hypothetical protein [bacterium]